MHTKYTTSAYAGQKFGRLTIVEVVRLARRNTKSTRTAFVCVCECGTNCTVDATHLITGHTTSCGCRNIEVVRHKSITHGKTKSKVYRAWHHMIERVSATPGTRDYTNYVARGITVCARWLTFENFYADMGEPPTVDHSLDRIDNDGNYEPSNCRWATNKMQGGNRRSVTRLDYQGKTYNLMELAEMVGIPKTTLRRRLYVYGMPIEEAVKP